MKCTGRHFLNALTTVSLLLTVGFSVIWASRALPRGWQIPLNLHWRTTTNSFQFVAGDNYVYAEQIEYTLNPVEGPSLSNPAAVMAFHNRLDAHSILRNYRGAAVKHYEFPVYLNTSRGTVAMIGTGKMIGIGFGYLPLLFFLLPMIRLPAAIRWAKVRYRRKPGQCIKCGYDLRASRGRCPECGTPIAVAIVS